MFDVVFVACFVASIGRILWPVDKSCSEMVSGQKLTCTGSAKEFFGMSVRGSHAIAWKPRYCVEATLLRGWAQICNPRVRNCVGFHAIA